MSFTAFKRRIKPGTRVRITNRLYPNLNREVAVVKAQTNAFTSPVTRTDGKTVESWVWYPKASGARMDGPDTVTFDDGTPEGQDWLTITILEDA